MLEAKVVGQACSIIILDGFKHRNPPRGFTAQRAEKITQQLTKVIPLNMAGRRGVSCIHCTCTLVSMLECSLSKGCTNFASGWEILDDFALNHHWNGFFCCVALRQCQRYGKLHKRKWSCMALCKDTLLPASLSTASCRMYSRSTLKPACYVVLSTN